VPLRRSPHVNRMIRGTTMENLRVPFYAVATDIGSGEEMVFGKGNTGSAVRASCSIPAQAALPKIQQLLGEHSR